MWLWNLLSRKIIRKITKQPYFLDQILNRLHLNIFLFLDQFGFSSTEEQADAESFKLIVYISIPLEH